MEKNRPSSGLIRDRSWGLWVSGWVLWGPVISAPMGSHHSSTRGYHFIVVIFILNIHYFIVVVFILNIHYLLCPTLYECDA